MDPNMVQRLLEQSAQQLELMKHQNAQQMELLQQMVATITRERELSPKYEAGPGQSTLMSELHGRMTTFSFDPDMDHCFTRWFDRHMDVLSKDGASLSDDARSRLLLGKLNVEVFERYKRQILPKTPSDIPFSEMINILKEMFDSRKSLFTIRYQCLKVEKHESEDFMEYTGRVNEMCEHANFNELDTEGLKSLLWIYGLKSHKDREIRPRLLAFLDKEAKENRRPTLHELYKECDRINTLLRTSRMIEDNPTQVNDIEAGSKNPTRAIECWNCGKSGHTSRECRKKQWTCNSCKQNGHKEKYCVKATQYRNRSKSRTEKRHQKRHCKQIALAGSAEAGVNAIREYITAEVQGHQVEFQLDTGSDITMLNVDAWKRLGSPKLRNTSLIVKDASGNRM
ncbi:unnamed protein product, partial [Nippostrongylus brasiliensis]|uniref:CCHC-type domain-containing protein n=2 Tax=Nippostrongylus brasiliensis TaxID=27835 RepID=A0A0N4XS21_NIPBR